MKTQRIQNPRFLGALGFLGFLGATGSRNPEIIRWAYLSWLSLFSLLVLFPTVDVNSKWAHYRLHPRRKGLLLFLGFLFFLGFLGGEYDSLHGLAFLACTAQFAIDHKKKSRAPMKELVPIFSLMFVAVILPLGGMLWFMTAAVRNEQVAVRQRLTEVYESQFAAAFERLEEYIGQQRAALAKHEKLPPASRFDALVRESVASSILVFDEHGNVAYPSSRRDVGGTSTVPEALELQAEVRRLLAAGSVSSAGAIVERMAGDEALRNARDASGRLILPALQLFCLQSMNVDEASPVLTALQQTATDYEMQMPSARRLFYLQELGKLGADVEPWLGAETVAAELEDAVFPPSVDGCGPVPGKDFYVLFSEDGRTVAVYNRLDLLVRLHRQISEVPKVEGVCIKLEQQDGAWRSRPFPLLGRNWFLGLHVEGDDPFSDTADRRIVRYVWIGNLVIAGMVFIFVLLVRSLLAQQRLTRMKNDFVATVTHELKTPLASTRMLVDTLLEGRVRDDVQRQEYLELIARENKRLSRLIDNFLTFSRMERNKRTFNFIEVEPSEIAETAMGTVHEKYEQCGCELAVDIAADLPLILVDQDSMVQVLLNLLDNACKYSGDDKRIKLRVFLEDHSICFSVEDQGIGMAKRELSKITERFYQVDQSMTRKVGGAGLGLSIVKFILDAHGATLDVESELGRGSCFTVKVPQNGENHGC